MSFKSMDKVVLQILKLTEKNYIGFTTAAYNTVEPGSLGFGWLAI